MTTRAVLVDAFGGPEALQFREVAVPAPAAGEIQLRQTAVGLNYIDVYHRTGLYKPPTMPFIPGMEAAGVVEAVGEGVTDFRPGEPVVYTGALGAYAELRNVAASRVVALPEAMSDRQAAGLMLKGLTALALLRRTVPLASGDVVLLHAAAGGVGLLMCQLARHFGLRLIGTAGGKEKTALAAAAGASEVIDYTREDFLPRVKELTGGRGVKVVFDSVGKDTFARSLDCLRPFGTLVSFGQASGAVPPFDITTLSGKGSLFLTRPTIMTHIAERGRYLEMTAELFALVAAGVIEVGVERTYPLREAAEAHRALESRQTRGATVLLP